LEDFQAGVERMATLLQAVLAGVDFITCGGTLDSTMLESDPLLMLDDDLCGMALRVARGIEVNDESLALDMIKQVGFSGNYLSEMHTAKHFRDEHFIPQLLPRDTYEAWRKAGAKSALDLAKERAREILANHQPHTLDPAVERELGEFRQMVATRPMEEFYAYEALEKQDLENL
jgi:trimethylamine--corrinoid protein Co-methyltransferase